MHPDSNLEIVSSQYLRKSPNVVDQYRSGRDVFDTRSHGRVYCEKHTRYVTICIPPKLNIAKVCVYNYSQVSIKPNLYLLYCPNMFVGFH